MDERSPALHKLLCDRGNTAYESAKFAVVLDHLVRPCLNGILGKIRDIFKMVVKRIPVYLAAFYDILHGDFAVGFFLQKLPEYVAHGSFRPIQKSYLQDHIGVIIQKSDIVFNIRRYSIFSFFETGRSYTGNDSMEPHKHKKSHTVLKFLPLAVCAILIILLFASGKEITVQTVLDYTPESPLAAAVVILLLYALKSASFVFPIAVLQIATGHLFRTPLALLVNFMGRAVTLMIPYWIGRFSGSGLIDSLSEKYPKLKDICSGQRENPVFLSFLLRTFCFLPGDVVSLYLGAVKIPFACYLAGGILGTTPGVVLSTIFGASIKDPGSPAFWISGMLMALMAVVSFGMYVYNRKRKISYSNHQEK